MAICGNNIPPNQHRPPINRLLFYIIMPKYSIKIVLYTYIIIIIIIIIIIKVNDMNNMPAHHLSVVFRNRFRPIKFKVLYG